MDIYSVIPKNTQLMLDNQRKFIPWIDGRSEEFMDVVLSETTSVGVRIYYSLPWHSPLDSKEAVEFSTEFWYTPSTDRELHAELRAATMLEF